MEILRGIREIKLDPIKRNALLYKECFFVSIGHTLAGSWLGLSFWKGGDERWSGK